MFETQFKPLQSNSPEELSHFKPTARQATSNRYMFGEDIDLTLSVRWWVHVITIQYGALGADHFHTDAEISTELTESKPQDLLGVH